jgi:hypothetical protein
VAFSLTERSVTFCYRSHDADRDETTTLDAFEFLRRFLQHV